MKYFIDTEFLEGTQKGWFGKTTKPTIDLISIGIVCEDGREYYAISKDFNLKEAWNRWQQRTGEGDRNNIEPKEYWIRDNVLKPIFIELRAKEVEEYNIAKSRNVALDFPEYSFCSREFKRLINKYGKTNKQIAEEIVQFIDARWIEEGNISKGFMYPGGTSIKEVKTTDVQFYGYYSDYDWAVFCWLFGKMIDLPKGFPMYCIDLKQILDTHIPINKDIVEYIQSCTDCGRTVTLEDLKFIFHKRIDAKQIKNSNEHNALADARWNFELYKFLQNYEVYR